MDTPVANTPLKSSRSSPTANNQPRNTPVVLTVGKGERPFGEGRFFHDLRVTQADVVRFAPHMRNWLTVCARMQMGCTPRQLQVMIELELRRPAPRPMIVDRLISRYAKTLKEQLHARIRS